MKSRKLEDWVIVLAVVTTGFGTVSTAIGLNILFGYLASALGTSLIFATGIYFALSVRHVLGARLYRHQALGLGIIVAALWVAFLIILTTKYYPSVEINYYPIVELGGSFFLVAFLALAYWLDSSIRSAILSDPLVRDSLHWREARKGLLPIVFASIALIVLFVASSPNTATTNPALDILYPIVTLGITLPGIVFIPLYAHRSGDRVLRRHLTWFGLSFASLFVLIILVSGTTGELNNLVGDAGVVAVSFCLYRSARSLVPIYEFTDEAS